MVRHSEKSYFPQPSKPRRAPASREEFDAAVRHILTSGDVDERAALAAMQAAHGRGDLAAVATVDTEMFSGKAGKGTEKALHQGYRWENQEEKTQRYRGVELFTLLKSLHEGGDDLKGYAVEAEELRGILAEMRQSRR